MNKLGYLIRKKRKDLNLTQADLEKIVNLTRVSISNIENGATVSVQTSKKLAEWLEINEWQVNILARTPLPNPDDYESINTVSTVELVEIAYLLNEFNLTTNKLKTIIKGIVELL